MNTATPLDIAVQAVRIYAESRPRPSQVTQSQAAEMLGLSRPTVGKMVRSGKIRLNACGMVPIGEVDRLLNAPGDGQSPTP